MYEELKNFHKQFLFNPTIQNINRFQKKSGFIIVGMGGSAHAADLIKDLKPEIDITVRRDYGLPQLPLDTLTNKLIILSSFSGNTEEAIAGFIEARQKGLAILAIASGGKLLALAQEENVPYIELPNGELEPRLALGLSTLALLYGMGLAEDLKQAKELVKTLVPQNFESVGKNLAERMKDYIPIIYASGLNRTVAYIWKIKLNETGKIPAYHCVFPELNHNEMNAYDIKEGNKKLGEKFYFLILKDPSDNPKILKRMAVTEKMYKERGLRVENIEMKGADSWQKIFASLVLADWVSYYSALQYGLQPEGVPMVEEFKKLI